MKDQYFGDINDYRKYGLLRSLGAASRLPIGVCWLRTANDSRTDGEFRSYLQQPNRFRRHDPGLYDPLTGLLQPGVERSVHLAERWNLVPGATYHHRLLSDDAADRRSYFAEAWELLQASPIIFFDPDNGIEVQSVPYGRAGSSKYVYWRELEAAARRGHSVVVYQHFRRESRPAFVHQLTVELQSRLDTPYVTSFWTAQVVFFLAAHADHAPHFASAGTRVEAAWKSQIRHAPQVVV